MLLDGGANVNTHDKQGRSVLMVRLLETFEDFDVSANNLYRT